MDLKALEHIGLSKNETELYSILLRSGPSSASAISEKSGMYRPYVYDTLERLLEKGLVNFVVESKKKIYSASRPEKILELIEERKQEIESLLPELSALADAKQAQTNISVIRGKEVVGTVIKTALEKLRKYGGEELILGVDDALYVKHAPVQIKKYIAAIEKEKLHERVISSEEMKAFVGGKTSHYMFLSKEFFNPTAIHIAGNCVCMIMWTEPLIGIIIESPDAADAYRKYFNLLWKIAKPKKWKRNA